MEVNGLYATRVPPWCVPIVLGTPHSNSSNNAETHILSREKKTRKTFSFSVKLHGVNTIRYCKSLRLHPRGSRSKEIKWSSFSDSPGSSYKKVFKGSRGSNFHSLMASWWTKRSNADLWVRLCFVKLIMSLPWTIISEDVPSSILVKSWRARPLTKSYAKKPRRISYK